MPARITPALAAGALGTLVMDALWYVRYRRGGGSDPFPSWERTGPVQKWKDAPAPAQMARKLLGIAGVDVPVERAPAVNDVMHWGYGTSWTAGYAAALGDRQRPWWSGLAFGTAVWLSDYVTLPLAGVYEPIWRYDANALWQDWSAHLVFGFAADGALRLLSR